MAFPITQMMKGAFVGGSVGAGIGLLGSFFYGPAPLPLYNVPGSKRRRILRDYGLQGDYPVTCFVARLRKTLLYDPSIPDSLDYFNKMCASLQRFFATLYAYYECRHDKNVTQQQIRVRQQGLKTLKHIRYLEIQVSGSKEVEELMKLLQHVRDFVTHHTLSVDGRQ